MVQKLLKFPCRLRTFVAGEISFAAKQDRVESTEEDHYRATGRSQFIGDRRLKCIDGSGGIVVVERHDRMDDRQVTEPDGCVLGKFGLETVGQGLGLLGITRESGNDGGGVFE